MTHRFTLNKAGTFSIDGTWSEWYLTEVCNASCGTGNQTWRRNCTTSTTTATTTSTKTATTATTTTIHLPPFACNGSNIKTNSCLVLICSSTDDLEAMTTTNTMATHVVAPLASMTTVAWETHWTARTSTATATFWQEIHSLKANSIVSGTSTKISKVHSGFESGSVNSVVQTTGALKSDKMEMSPATLSQKNGGISCVTAMTELISPSLSCLITSGNKNFEPSNAIGSIPQRTDLPNSIIQHYSSSQPGLDAIIPSLSSTSSTTYASSIRFASAQSTAQVDADPKFSHARSLQDVSISPTSSFSEIPPDFASSEYYFNSCNFPLPIRQGWPSASAYTPTSESQAEL